MFKLLLETLYAGEFSRWYDALMKVSAHHEIYCSVADWRAPVATRVLKFILCASSLVSARILLKTIIRS